MKLIGSLGSPYVRKVRIVLAEKKIECPLVLENVWATDSEIHQSNPLGKVPCLIMDDGGALFDSSVIVEYIDTLSPVGKLYPATSRERIETRCWEALADGVMDAGVLARLEVVQREPHQRSQAWIDRQMLKVTDGLAAMSKGLGDRVWCTSNHLTLADISVGCALEWLDFRFPEIAWRDTHPNLAAYQEKLGKRQSFIDTVPAA